MLPGPSLYLCHGTHLVAVVTAAQPALTGSLKGRTWVYDVAMMVSRPAMLALSAALLYALSLPLGKLFLSSVSPYSLASWLYLGAGLGMAGMLMLRREKATFRFTRSELPYAVAMVVLDIAAPILLLIGLMNSTAASASALTNMEIVATSVIALVFFRETVSSRGWTAIALITCASILLSLEPGAVALSPGSLLVIAATCCWGVENNCTRMLSRLDSSSIVVIKGLGAGIGAGIVALSVDGQIDTSWMSVVIMGAGFLTYGLSIDLYIRAQANLGAAKTSAYYASAPFLGVALSFLLLRESVPTFFWAGIALMVLATFFLITDTIQTQHTHAHSHVVVVEHSHGSLTHTHPIEFTHSHLHAHGANVSGDHDHLDHDHSDVEVPSHRH